MTISDFSRDVVGVQDRCKRLLDTLDALTLIDVCHFPERGESLISKAVMQAESLTCHLRDMLFDSTAASQDAYFAKTAELHGTKVQYSDGVFMVSLPRLLPKKRCRNSDDFLLTPVRYALDAYAKEHGNPSFRNCTVCIEHVYNKTAKGVDIHDYDNLQTKKLLDLVALYSMVDDSGKYCNLFQTTRLEDKPCTRIFVMSQDHFQAWLMDRNSPKKQGEFDLKNGLS